MKTTFVWDQAHSIWSWIVRCFGKMRQLWMNSNSFSPESLWGKICLQCICEASQFFVLLGQICINLSLVFEADSRAGTYFLFLLFSLGVFLLSFSLKLIHSWVFSPNIGTFCVLFSSRQRCKAEQECAFTLRFGSAIKISQGALVRLLSRNFDKKSCFTLVFRALVWTLVIEA